MAAKVSLANTTERLLFQHPNSLGASSSEFQVLCWTTPPVFQRRLLTSFVYLSFLSCIFLDHLRLSFLEPVIPYQQPADHVSFLFPDFWDVGKMTEKNGPADSIFV